MLGASGADQLHGEAADFFLSLLRAARVALAAAIGLEDEILGLGLDALDLGDVAVEFAEVGADEGVAFADLDGRAWD